MADAVLKKEVCMSCGADVRDGTYFCHACGKPIVNEQDGLKAQEVSNNAFVGDDPLTAKAEKTEKLATAAAERKRSRAGQRKAKQVVWEEPGPSSNRIFVLVSLLIFIIAALVVFLTVFMK